MRWRLGLPVCMALVLMRTAGAQDAAVPDWQTKAGGKMQFEVASVKEGKPDTGMVPSFPLSPDDSFRQTGGLFRAEFPVVSYITFAYKLFLTREQQDAMLASFPSWVKEQKFVIEARAPADATKDQYRLMMQSLLAERFGLKLHFERRDTAVLLMTLETPGKLGPQLRPHSEGPACGSPQEKDVFPTVCYAFQLERRDGLFLTGSRDTTMQLLAGFLGLSGAMMGEIGRPVVDETGLTGTYDFTLQVAPPPKPDSAAVDVQGPTFLQAVREQLGIRLKPGRSVLSVPVIDRLERPTED